MGLYDTRLAELAGPRQRDRRVFRRAPPVSAPRPYTIPRATSEAPRPPTNIQSLLFGRDAGWTVEKSKAWAKANGYKHGKVDVTDQYIRIRQFDPKGLKVKRTITLGHGIKAVVAREEDTAMKSRRTSKKGSSRRTAKRSVSAAKPAFGSPEFRAQYLGKGKKSRKAKRTTREAPVVRATATVVAAKRKPRRRKLRSSTVRAAASRTVR